MVRQLFAIEPTGLGRADTVATARKGADPTWVAPTINKGFPMLYTIAVILLILWLLGMVSSVTIGGFIHVLLVIAIIVVLLRVISGRKVV
jgi:hypothetical protein